MLYEKRIYVRARPAAGVCASASKSVTLKLWDKHGHQAGRLLDHTRWRIGKPGADYPLQWELLADSRAEMERVQERSGLAKAREPTSETIGPIIANIKSSFLRPTAFSAVK